MSGVYFVTGKLGSGKSLISVSKIVDYIQEGRRVATNLDLNFDKWINPFVDRMHVVRVPDHPKISDFEMIGQGYDGPYQGEHRNGLLVLDECATWMNSRDWQGADRQKVINWMLHMRKMRWDMIILVQSHVMIDKQIREGIGEQIGYCRRVDRLRWGFILELLLHKPACFLLGVETLMPQVHLCMICYGSSPQAPEIDKWVYMGGHSLYRCYDTEQQFNPNYEHGPFCFLPPLYYRKTSPMVHFYEITTGYLSRLGRQLQNRPTRLFFFLGMFTSWYVGVSADKPVPVADSKTANFAIKNDLQDYIFTGAFCVGGDCDYYFTDDTGQPINSETLDITQKGNKLLVRKGNHSRLFDIP